jgi:hypothetical protein
MRRMLVTVSVLGYLIAVNARESVCAQKDGAAKQPKKNHKPRFTIGKDTTSGKTSGERGKLLADFWFSIVVTSHEKYMNASDRTEQNHHNLTLATALAGYHRDHGRYPKTLKALAPDYLPEIPQDLFNGRPLIYRPSDDGYLLYSVGVNGKDDGGRTYGEEPYGSDDLVVRMPLPR